ncbi:MAG: hypothetical protein C0407_09575 [Desulfobacca sp.]|nr:hypothetical protein [Desulfobacca sp.]
MKDVRRFRDKLKREDGISVIALIVAILLLGSIGYIMSSLMSGSQESVPRILDSSRAFYIAQGGVEYVGKYLNGQSSWMSLISPPTSQTLGTGNFTVTYSPVDASNLNATITGNSGTAHRGISVSYRKSGFAIRSQGGISMGNNAVLDCDPSDPFNQICNSTNLNTCPCTQQSTPVSAMLPITVPNSPVPPAPAIGCNISGIQTIPAGTYYCSAGMIFNNNANVSVSGSVTIFTTTFTLNNNVRFNSPGSAANLLILAQGNVNLNNNARFRGAIYAPGYDINISNNVIFTGFFAGGRPGVWNTVSINNNANFDMTAGSTSAYFNVAGGGSGSAMSLTSWQE